MSENGSGVIVKVVNPTEEPATLRIKGDWTGVKDAAFEYYAPGSLTVANSMENKHAVALQKAPPKRPMAMMSCSPFPPSLQAC